MTDIPAEYLWRVRKAQRAMAAAGHDLLILDSGEILAWLSGYSVSETMYRAIFLPVDGMPWIILRDLDAAPCAEGGWITDIVGYPDTEIPEDVMGRELCQRGFRNARIAVDTTSVSWNPVRAERLGAHLRHSIAGMAGITESLRWIKSETEIACLAQASAIADATMAELAASVRPGMSTRDAAAIAAASFLRRGADIGETGPILRGEGSHEFLHGLARGDVLTDTCVLHAELIPYVQGYGARMMRPIFLGCPTRLQKEVAEHLVALQDDQIAAMKPGAIAADVDRIVREGVLRAGLRTNYTNVTAYTLGLYSRTPRSSDFSRVLLPDQKWMLEENMVFHIYTTAEGMGFSETVVVRPDGGQRLTRMPRRILQYVE